MRKINLLTVFLLSFFIFNCETDNINPTDPNSKFKKVKISSLSQEPYLAGLLDKAGFKNISNGRTNGEGTNIDTNSILMVLQADSLSYSYTFKVHDKTTYNSFTNLVFKKVIDGFNAFYLKYESNDTLLDNIKGFTGKVTSYNLSWEVITTQYFDNGQIVDNPISNGRTQNCNPAVSVNTVCTQEVFDGWEQTNGAPIYKCLERVTTITLDYAHCFVGGSGGDPNYSYNWSNGTFVPFHYWDGGGGSGSASGNYNSTGITTCTSGDGGTSLESGDDPNGCGDGIGIYLPPNAEILELVLEENSFALLDIPCDQLPKWQALAQSEAPQTVKDKINQLDNNTNWFQDWAIQTLNGANGTVANMDNFGVTVSTLPNNPITGTAFTPEGFLDYFRRNINDFVEGSTFSPYCQTPSLCTQETAPVGLDEFHRAVSWVQRLGV